MTSGNKRRRGFSVVELLVCVAIIAVMAAITYPIVRSAKRRSYDATCASNLRSLWIATSLYREDNAGHADAGDMYQMGLPPFEWVASLMNERRLHCPLRPSKPERMGDYMYNVGDPDSDQANQDWIAAVTRHGAQTVIFYDFLHGDRDTLTLTTYPHLGLGIDLGGTYRRQNKTGRLVTISETAAWFASGP